MRAAGVGGWRLSALHTVATPKAAEAEAGWAKTNNSGQPQCLPLTPYQQSSGQWPLCRDVRSLDISALDEVWNPRGN